MDLRFEDLFISMIVLKLPKQDMERRLETLKTTFAFARAIVVLGDLSDVCTLQRA